MHAQKRPETEIPEAALSFHLWPTFVFSTSRKTRPRQSRDGPVGCWRNVPTQSLSAKPDRGLHVCSLSFSPSLFLSLFSYFLIYFSWYMRKSVTTSLTPAKETHVSGTIHDKEYRLYKNSLDESLNKLQQLTTNLKVQLKMKNSLENYWSVPVWRAERKKRKKNIHSPRGL